MSISAGQRLAAAGALVALLAAAGPRGAGSRSAAISRRVGQAARGDSRASVGS